MPAIITESQAENIVKLMVKKALVQRCIEVLTEFSVIETAFDTSLATYLYNFAQNVLDNPDMYIDKAWELILFSYPTLVNSFVTNIVTYDFIMGNANSIYKNIFQASLQFNNNIAAEGAYNSDIFFHLSNYYNND